jgi:hypothetical protein
MKLSTLTSHTAAVSLFEFDWSFRKLDLKADENKNLSR